MIRLIYEMLKGINKNIDKNEQLKEKNRKNALEEEMDMYGLDEDEKELVRKNRLINRTWQCRWNNEK